MNQEKANKELVTKDFQKTDLLVQEEVEKNIALVQEKMGSFLMKQEKMNKELIT